MPSACMTWTMQRLTSASPSVGAYWRAAAHDRAATELINDAYESAGNVEVSGNPPASEITSSRSVSAIRSRIADDFMTFVRSANSAA